MPAVAVATDRIRVLLYPAAGQSPVTRTIPNTLSGLQEPVGGYVEPLAIPVDGLYIYCNEEGLLRRLPWNRDVAVDGGVHRLHGPFYVTRVDEHGDNVDLTDEDIELVRQHLP